MFAAIRSDHARQMAVGETERQTLRQNMNDMMPALEQGLPVAIPDDRVRAAFPPDQANRMLDEMHVGQQAGLLMKGMEFQPFDQAAQAVQSLQVPGSVQSGRIVLRRGQLAGQGMNQTDAPASEDPIDTRLRLQVAARAQSMLQQRQQAIGADPAGYAQRSPDVQQAFQALQQSPSDPQALQTYAAATTALQRQLGVPDGSTRLLTNPQAAGLVRTLTFQDPAQGDTSAQLDKLAGQYGSFWPQVFGEMVTQGKLPRDYQVLANMDQPGQIVPRQDVQRMLTFMGQKGGPKEMLGDLPAGTEQQLRQGVDSVMSDFHATTAATNGNGGLQLYNDVRDTVMHLAGYRMAVSGSTDASGALSTAYKDIIGAKYDFDGSMRVPKMVDGQPLSMSDARTATQAMQAGLGPQDVAQINPGSTPGLSAQDNQAAYLRTVQRSGFWVPNKDDSGLVLVAPVRNSSTPQMVLRADRSPVQMLFRDMHRQLGAMATAEQPPAGFDPTMTAR